MDEFSLEVVTKDVSLEQLTSFAFGYVHKYVISKEDILENIVMTADYAILTSNKRVCIFIRCNENSYVHQFTHDKKTNTTYNDYFIENENREIYDITLKLIGKTYDDSFTNPQECVDICLLQCFDLQKGFTFTHVDTLFLLETYVCVKPRMSEITTKPLVDD